MHEKWVKDLTELAFKPQEPILSWLTKPKKITEALKRHYSTFSLRLLYQDFQSAEAEEAKVLKIDAKEKVFVRQVVIEGDEIPRTAGKVIVPLATYEKFKDQFEQLKEKPIGESFLYTHPNVKREAFEYAYLQEENSLIPYLKEGVFARRSLFLIENTPLLIVEYFLPTLDHYVLPSTS